MRHVAFKVLILPLFFMLSCLPAGKNEGVDAPENVRDLLQFTTLDGLEKDANLFKDQYLFINFWATWCGPCIKEMPSIEEMADHFAGKNLSVILISNEKPSRVKNFVGIQGIKAAVYLMPNAMETFSIDALPTTLLVAPSGKVILRHEGARDWNSAEVTTQLDSLMTANN